MVRIWVCFTACTILASAGCSSESESQAPQAVVASSQKTHARSRIVALGDSLTAGLGLVSSDAYPAALQRLLDAAGYQFEIVNAGVSGDTSAGGLRRLDWVLEGDVQILILALGANDGLRGVPVAETRKNLSTIIERARERRVHVLLAGMEAPPNFGASYTSAFRNVFRDLARQYSLAFLPFLLEDVAGVPALNQADGIHPTPAGARVIADHVWRVLKPMVDQAGRS